MPTIQQLAPQNLDRLAANPYPGRGIVLGCTARGDALVQLYWIMGRSANSRNRRFVADGPRLRTEPVDASRVERPELVIYTAMDVVGDHHVVTNGDHTDTIVHGLQAGEAPAAALASRHHEPDGPHYTPRIAGGIRTAEGTAWLAIVKADPADPARSLRYHFAYEALEPGFGWGITTYAGDGDPLPSFSGEPLALPLSVAPEALAEHYWAKLHPENRVALACKLLTPPDGGCRIAVINAHA